ncbi:extracellular solute-binding protein [Cohnella sp. CFH 77786]|uniref:ABC transporter substrate-binding protein n=1 Tax=Cohnella sp. CFH 77786 TaxID=2662265 RepID=UPI001C61066E|nr:extracellular solute-binding protein [Cohnella sp. CFH 77786]MBW5449414.1 extracellular solute-binding protein [Cohnella sp. CFH 77786]
MKKVLSVLMAFALVLLAACGHNGSNEKSAESTQPASTEAASPSPSASEEPSTKPAKNVELKFWSFEPKDDANREIFKKIIDDFNNSHPNIKIVPEYFNDEPFKQKIKVGLASNDLPDIFSYWTGDQFKTLVDANAVGDITDVLGADEAFKNSITPGGLDAYSYNGKNYAIPTQIASVNLWYNKEILAKYNIAPPQTWAELLAAVDTLNANKVTPITVAGKDRWPVLHWLSYLQQRVGGDSTFAAAAEANDFTGESFVKAGEMLNDLALNHKGFVSGFLGLDYGAAESMFLNDKAAFYLQGDWAVGSFTQKDEFAAKVGFVPFPSVDGGQGASTTYQGGFGIGYAISAKAAENYKAEAYEALKYLSSWKTREALTKMNGTTPPFTDFQAPEGMKPLAAEVMKYVSSNAKGFFPYYDQALKPKPAENFLNAATTIAGKKGVDVKAELAKITQE